MDQRLSNEITRMQTGDFSGYQDFYDMTSLYTYNLLYNIVKEDANAILPDVYQDIYARIGELQFTDDFYQWAGTITTDKALSILVEKSQFSIGNLMGAAENGYDRSSEDGEGFIPEMAMEDREFHRILEQKLQELPIMHQVVMQYFYYENLSVAEIAKKLNCSDKQIRIIIKQIKAVMKNVVLEKYGPQGEPLYSVGKVPLAWICFQSAVGLTLGGVAIAGAAGGLAVGGAAADVVAKGAAVGGAAGGAVSGAAGGAAGGMAGSAAGGIAGSTAGGVAGSAMAGSGMSAGGVASGAAVGSGMSAGGVASGVASGAAVGSGMSAGGVASGAVAGGAAAGGAAGSGMAAGFLGTIGGKIALGIAGAAIVAGGGIGIHHIATNDKNKETGEIAYPTEIDADLQTTEEQSGSLEANDTEVVEEESINTGFYTLREYNYYNSGMLDGAENGYCFSYNAYDVEGEGYEKLTEAVQLNNDKAYSDLNYQENDYMEMSANSMDTISLEYRQTIRRADNVVLSFSWDEYSYSGGAHGYNYVYGETYDVETGAMISFSDLGDIKADVKTHIMNQISDSGYIEATNEGYEDTIDTQLNEGSVIWYLADGNLVIYFNSYELAYYAAGPLCVEIPTDDLPGFTEKYKSNGSCYKRLYSGTSYMVDINNDGKQEALSISSGTDESDYMTTSSILVDGNVAVSGITSMDYVDSFKATYIRKADGEQYCLATSDWENGYCDVCLYQIVDGAFVSIGQYSGQDSDEIIFVNDRVFIYDKIDVLQSKLGGRYYDITPEGLVPLSERYEYDKSTGSYLKLPVAKIDVNVKLMDASGNMVDGIIPAGSSITLDWCDQNGHLGFYLEDGTYGELEYKNSTPGENYWGHYINGIKEDDVFENIMYAG